MYITTITDRIHFGSNSACGPHLRRIRRDPREQLGPGRLPTQSIANPGVCPESPLRLAQMLVGPCLMLVCAGGCPLVGVGGYTP